MLDTHAGRQAIDIYPSRVHAVLTNRHFVPVCRIQSLVIQNTPTSCNTKCNIPAGKLWQLPLNGKLAKIKGNLLIFLH